MKDQEPDMKPILTDWISRDELAAELNVTASTLARWTTIGTGPPLVKVGRRVLYRRAAVKKWLAEMERKSRHG